MSMTMERLDHVTAPSTTTRRRGWWMAVAALVILALGGLGGWWMKSTTSDNPKAMAGGYQDLTARQQQMLDVLHRSEAALQSGDSAAFVALFTPDSVLVSPGGVTSGVDSFANLPAGGEKIELLDPVLFNGNIATVVVRYPEGLATDVFEFTTTGDVLITRHTIFTPVA